jgi:hypothetical protein
MKKNICKHCTEGYVKKNGVYTPCKHCITPDRFKKTIEQAIKNCDLTSDYERKGALTRIKENLPSFPVVAMMEAEQYGKFSKEFIKMLRDAYDIKPFMDVKYKIDEEW